jgi:glutathione S-transferase
VGAGLLTLYTTPLSANGRKPLAVCRHLGLSPRIEVVNVYAGEGRTPAYLAINPLGKVPTLVDGDLVLWESNAILQYLAEAHADGRLWSRDPRRRADIARWLFWEASHWQPALSQVLAGFVGPLVVPALAGTQPLPADWSDAALGGQLDLLEAHLSSRALLAGGELTLADFSVAAMLMYARPAGFPFERYPEIAAWYGRIEATEAWRATAAGPWVY